MSELNKTLVDIAANNMAVLCADVEEVATLVADLKVIDTNVEIKDWQEKLYTRFDMKLMYHGGNVININECAHAEFWKEAYLLAYSICNSPYLETSADSAYSANAAERTNALIAELEDFLTTLNSNLEKPCSGCTNMYNNSCWLTNTVGE